MGDRRANDARSKRDEAYIILCEGRDPAIAKRLKIEANLEASRQTFERVARRWHDNAKGQWAKRHANDVMRSLERDVFASIGNLPIADLTPPLILAALREIEARGSIETAKRVLQRVSAVFGFAIAEGLVKTDPSERLDAALKPLRRGRHLLNRAGYHGHHVPHGFRAAFSTIMNEWAERHGKDGDRAIIDLMLAHVPKGKVEGAYNRAAYMPRRRELAQVWAEMLCEGLSETSG